MFRSLYEVVTQLLFVTRRIQEHTDDIAKLRADLTSTQEDLRDLSEKVRLLSVEIHHWREHERLQRENLAKDLKIALLQFERRQLPPPGED